jgi:cardiolipin synthase
MESWSQSRIFHSGDEFFGSLQEDIKKARESITIESYIFSYDKLTRPLLQSLLSARDRGCRIRLVVDGFGSYNSIPALDRFCSENALDFRVFHPLPYPLLWLRRLFSRQGLHRSVVFQNLNRRTHRKICILDEKRAYLGSFNFTQEHCESIVGATAWRDTGVWVEGNAVKRLVLAFQVTYLRTSIEGIANWIGRWKPSKDRYDKILRLNTTKKMRQHLYRDLVRRVSTARRRVYITTAYFLPKRSLLVALLKAKNRGVDVKLLIPGRSDVPMVKWAANPILRFLAMKALPIYEYQKSILHAKTMILDDEVFIGSFNLNHRSLLHDLEVEVILNDPASIENMLQHWQVDLTHAKPLTEGDVSHPSWILRIFYGFAFRLRYML